MGEDHDITTSSKKGNKTSEVRAPVHHRLRVAEIAKESLPKGNDPKTPHDVVKSSNHSPRLTFSTTKRI